MLSKTESDDEDSSEFICDSKSAVLIDTNGFMIPVQFGIDIFSELQRLGFSNFLTIPAVIFELEKISKTASGNDRTAARVALALSKKCRLLETPHEKGVRKYADDIIIESALRHPVSVLTNDAGLRQKLMKRGIPVVSMRQMHRLDIINQK
ncbi:DNA-binding protein [Methanimicrococcus stummii]|uniref:type II toxin-antitoxin system VapC family toxin n=1 Tax=Methanimicrococcus stummii TaxID=3028294 RepID=UPI00292E8675|nr:DNA-binding protein [Methanimicrococcus sp. Es2]